MLAVMREEPKIRNANAQLARQSIAEDFGFDAKVSEWKALYIRLMHSH